MYSTQSPPRTPPSASASSSRFSPVVLSLSTRPTPPLTIVASDVEMDEELVGSQIGTSTRKTPEKKRSIEVPGIVLTEPEHLAPYASRTPSPPPKSILLLSPCQIELDAFTSSSKPESSSFYSATRPYSPAFAQLLHGRQSPNSTTTTARMRMTVLLMILAICAWHLYAYAHDVDVDTITIDVDPVSVGDTPGYISGASTL